MNVDRNWEVGFWIIAIALVVTLFCALHASGASSASSHSISDPQAAASGSRPTQGEIRVPSRPSQAALHVPRIATVFECHEGGRHIYSDQRCGSNPDEHAILAPNGMNAQDTSVLSSPDAVLARSRSERADIKEPMLETSRSECDSIEQQKNSINARMREGYTSVEGEWFRDRLRVLAARYYDLHCRRFR